MVQLIVPHSMLNSWVSDPSSHLKLVPHVLMSLINQPCNNSKLKIQFATVTRVLRKLFYLKAAKYCLVYIRFSIAHKHHLCLLRFLGGKERVPLG